MKIKYLFLLTELLLTVCQNSGKLPTAESGNAARSTSDDVSAADNKTNGDTRHRGVGQIVGGWNLIWTSYNGKIRDTGKPIQFMVYSHTLF